MKATFEWLKELCPALASVDEARRLFEAVGLEVAGVEANGSSDAIIDLEVPSNRSDLLGIIGLARELAAAKGERLVLPPVKELAAVSVSPTLTVRVEDSEGCLRYTALEAKFVSQEKTPDWIRARLEALGVRSILPIVDLTNYVMLEIGQPMHAFDAKALRGQTILVRRARPGESFVTLDEQTLTLCEEDLLIADAERGIALAGIIGGIESGIKVFSREVVFESAWFDRARIRATSRRHQVRTESSLRFEREVNPEGVVWAQMRIAYLLESEGLGKASDTFIDLYPRPDQRRSARYSVERYFRKIGHNVPEDKQHEILALLGFEKTSEENRDAIYQVPSHRRDVFEEEDLMEEVARHAGYDSIPEKVSPMPVSTGDMDEGFHLEDRLRTVLVGWGYQECISLPLRSVGRNEIDPMTGRPGVAVQNPMSEELSVLRPSLVPGLVDALSGNIRHGVTIQPVFEIGAVFHTEGTRPGEERRLAMILPGEIGIGDWEHNTKVRRGSSARLKGLVETLMKRLGEPSRCRSADPQGDIIQSGAFLVWENNLGTRIGWLGEVRQSYREMHGIRSKLYAAEISLDLVRAGKTLPVFTNWSPYPAVSRDLSMIVPEGISYGEIEDVIRRAGGEHLTTVNLFDRYTGKTLGTGEVSIALEMVFQSKERTLTRGEIDEVIRRVIGELEERGVRVRK